MMAYVFLYLLACIIIVMLLFIFPWIEWRRCCRRPVDPPPPAIDSKSPKDHQLTPTPSYSEFAPPDYETAVKHDPKKSLAPSPSVFVIEMPFEASR